MRQRFIFLLLLIALIFGGYLRLLKLGAQSYWQDELISVLIGKADCQSIVVFCARGDVNPPLYYLLIGAWGKIWGFSEFSTRFFSVILGILGIAAIFWLGRELLSERAGVSASLLVALNYGHLYFSQEARHYTLVFLLTVLSYLFLVRFLKNNRLDDKLFYFLFTTALLYTHYFGIFILAAQMIFLFYFWVLGRNKIKSFFSLFWPALLVAGGYLFWFEGLQHVLNLGSYWTSKPDCFFFIDYFLDFIGRDFWLFFVFVFLVVLYFLRHPAPAAFPDQRGLFFFWMVCPLLFPYLRAFHHPSPLVSRYTIVILPALILAVVGGLETIRSRRLAGLFLVLILFLSVRVIFRPGIYLEKINHEKWREIAEFVMKIDPKNCYLVFGTYRTDFWKYYFERKNDYRKIYWVSHNQPEFFHNPRILKLDGFWLLEMKDYLTLEVQQFLEKKFSSYLRLDFNYGRVTLYKLN